MDPLTSFAKKAKHAIKKAPTLRPASTSVVNNTSNTSSSSTDTSFGIKMMVEIYTIEVIVRSFLSYC